MIIAVDASLSNTAIVRGTIDSYEVECFGSKPIGHSVPERFGRYEDMIDRMITWLSDRTHYDAVYIEGYSLGHARPGVSDITEYGGLLRWHLLDLSDRIIEVAPMTLKKFCAGTGAAKKDMVAAHLTKRYDVLFNTSDEFDAFGLYRLGLAAEGLAQPENKAQREAVDRVLGIVAPNKSKRTANPLDEMLWKA